MDLGENEIKALKSQVNNNKHIKISYNEYEYEIMKFYDRNIQLGNLKKEKRFNIKIKELNNNKLKYRNNKKVNNAINFNNIKITVRDLNNNKKL